MGRIKKTRGKSCGKDADAARGRADLIDVDCADQSGKNAKYLVGCQNIHVSAGQTSHRSVQRSFVTSDQRPEAPQNPMSAVATPIPARDNLPRDARAPPGPTPGPTRARWSSRGRNRVRANKENSTAIVLLPEAKEYQGGERRRRVLAAAPCDFFELLGLDCDCDDKEVKAAFRRLTKKTHPDIVGAVAEPRRFTQLGVRDPVQRLRRGRRTVRLSKGPGKPSTAVLSSTASP